MKISSVLAVLLSGIVLLTGCQRTLLMFKGVRNPRILPVKEIDRYLLHKKVPLYDGSFILKDSLSFMQFLGKVKILPAVLFFNRQGELLKINDSGYCAGVAYHFACMMQADTAYPVDTSFRLGDITGLVASTGDTANRITPEDADVVLVGCWATCFGGININVFGVLEAAASVQHVKKKIYLIDGDLIREWGLKGKPWISFY